MSRLSLERIVFADDPDQAILERCVGTWKEERIDGHVVLRLDDPPIMPMIPVFIAIPFSTHGKLSQQRGVDKYGRPIFRHAWKWGGHKDHVTLEPSFVWPYPHCHPWPNINIYIRNGKIVDINSAVEIVQHV